MKKYLLVLSILLAAGLFIGVYLLKPQQAEAECRTFPGVLMKGKSNNNVKLVQEYMISASTLAAGNNTGYFGVLTEAAVKAQYAKFGLTVYNTVSQTLWEKMFPCGAGQTPVVSVAPSVQTDNFGSRIFMDRDGANFSWIGAQGTGTDGNRVAIGFNSDKTTGLIQAINFRTGDVHRLVINYAGNVGIGTINPLAGLHIDRGSTNNPALMLSSSGLGWGSGIQFVNNGANKTYGIYTGNDGIFRLTDEQTKTGRIWFQPDSSVILQPKGGNVGIGTINPTEKLEVNGYVKSKGNITGDIVFQKNGETLWTMFEEEDGLMLKSAKTGKVYKLLMEEVK